MPWEVLTIDNKRFNQEDSWTHLMNYCNSKKVGIRKMKLFLEDSVLHLPENAEGYWVATSMNALMSGPRAHKYGAGFVQGDTVRIAWLSYDPTGRVIRESETRHIANEKQIIWRPDCRDRLLIR